MKRLILFLSACCLATFTAFADTNPFVTNATVNPNPIPGANPFAVLSFDVGNTGSNPIGNLDIDSNPDPIILTITLANGTYDNVHYASPQAAVGGTWANYFTWTYNATTNTYTGTQNTTIPAADGGSITIAYHVTTATAAPGGNNGLNVNLTSNGNAPNGPGTNDINDDQTDSKTYVMGPLPVTLVSFSAKPENKTTLLQWVSSEEKNTDRFEIQHSVNTKNWRTIGEVKAAGNSKTPQNYVFTHASPLSAANYYRLKMIDLDGSFEVSKTASVVFGEISAQPYVYPNPTSGSIRLGQTDFSKIETVELVNTNGQVVHKTNTFSQEGINLRMAKGLYILKISNTDGSTANLKLVVTD